MSEATPSSSSPADALTRSPADTDSSIPPPIKSISSTDVQNFPPLELHRTNTVSTTCSRPEQHPHHRHLRRRVDLRLVPILSALYLLCFLCRQNIGNAKTFHLSPDLHLSPQDYQLALTAFFFTYSLFDIPANILLKLLRPNVWLPLITLCSGVVTVGMGLTQNSGGLIATRLVLGMAECGLFPGVAYVITLWYRKKEAQFRQALFFCAASMAGAFAGALAVGLAKMDGVAGLEGWRWILIIEGILTVAVAIMAFWIVLDIPSRTTFLDEEEKEFLLHRLSTDEFGEEVRLLTPEEQEHIHATTITMLQVFRQVFTDFHLPLYILVFWGITCPLYSISLCLPTIVVEMGYTKSQANFLTIPIYISACLLSLLVAFFSDHLGVRAPFLAGSFATMILGFSIAAAAPKAAYGGVFIAACGVYPAFPGMITWFSNNLASSRARAIAMALIIGMGSYLLGHCLNLGFVSLGAAAGGVLYMRYVLENRRRGEERKRREEVVEREVERARKEGGGDAEEREERLRHAFLVRREEELAREGDRSVWFQYTL
ncbi:major facilitator superfamily domain-containing protein [Trichophaea hybrida]|nr:major facilitator superfamily domain-containing protein [Trichophaea hybrida]